VHTVARCTFIAASPPPPPPPSPARAEGEVLEYELSVELACLEPVSHWDDARLRAVQQKAALAFRVAAESLITTANATAAPPPPPAGGRRRLDASSEQARSVLRSRAGGLTASGLEQAYAGWAELAPSAYAASLFFNATILAAPNFVETSVVVAPPPPPATAGDELPMWLWGAIGGASGMLLCLVGIIGYRLVWRREAAASVAPHAGSDAEEPEGEEIEGRRARTSAEQGRLTGVVPPKAS